mmetsp:Transcript_14057/g.41174  ORF Transcript_14057/g.41174 Transcript_14057/m.41174 type:complete len:243 (-) Transcript_14057:2676-3404(-)
MIPGHSRLPRRLQQPARDLQTKHGYVPPLKDRSAAPPLPVPPPHPVDLVTARGEQLRRQLPPQEECCPVNGEGEHPPGMSEPRQADYVPLVPSLQILIGGPGGRRGRRRPMRFPHRPTDRSNQRGMLPPRTIVELIRRGRGEEDEGSDEGAHGDVNDRTWTDARGGTAVRKLTRGAGYHPHQHVQSSRVLILMERSSIEVDQSGCPGVICVQCAGEPFSRQRNEVQYRRANDGGDPEEQYRR